MHSVQSSLPCITVRYELRVVLHAHGAQVGSGYRRSFSHFPNLKQSRGNALWLIREIYLYLREHMSFPMGLPWPSMKSAGLNILEKSGRVEIGVSHMASFCVPV